MSPSGRCYRKSISWLVDRIFRRRRCVRRAPRRVDSIGQTQTRRNVRDAAGPASIADTTRLRGSCITGRPQWMRVGQAVASPPARHSGCGADAVKMAIPAQPRSSRQRSCLRGPANAKTLRGMACGGTRPASPAFSSGGSFTPTSRPVRKAAGRSHMGHERPDRPPSTMAASPQRPDILGESCGDRAKRRRSPLA
jgi:hypothetical protein